MNLADVLQKLSYGPLSELAIGGTGSGSVPADHVPKLTQLVGMALGALYTRFPLRLRSITLQTDASLYEYALRTEYAQTSSSTQPIKYLQDTVADPFTGDVLKVNAIYDASTNDELPLNKRDEDLSWFTTGYDTLRMGYPVTGDQYRIEYRARHAALPVNPTTPGDVVINLPEELVPALLAHVAGAVYGGMSMEGALAKSQGHLSEFENQCSMHEALNTWDQHNEPARDPICRDGWA